MPLVCSGVHARWLRSGAARSVSCVVLCQVAQDLLSPLRRGLAGGEDGALEAAPDVLRKLASGLDGPPPGPPCKGGWSLGGVRPSSPPRPRPPRRAGRAGC